MFILLNYKDKKNTSLVPHIISSFSLVHTTRNRMLLFIVKMVSRTSNNQFECSNMHHSHDLSEQINIAEKAAHACYPFSPVNERQETRLVSHRINPGISYSRRVSTTKSVFAFLKRQFS